MANAAIAAVIAIIATVSCVNHAANGSVNDAQIEASETYLDMANTTIQTLRIITRDGQTSAISTPAEVAMPLPPLKCSQQVKLCPSTAATPAHTRIASYA